MNCPICNTPLVLNERQGIEIDYCPQCRGIWLDRGELDKMIERSIGTLRRKDDDDRNERRRYQDDDHTRKRRESFLGELFDF